MDIYEEIKRGQDQAEELFKKALSPTLNEMVDDIRKAKALPDGTIKEWGGKKYKKAGGQWRPVGKGSNSSKEGESEGSDTAEPADLSEHAKNASEGALLNATKTSPDPKIREAAHKELMRRKNEESQETFKAPEEGGEKAPDMKTEEKPAEKKEKKPEAKKEETTVSKISAAAKDFESGKITEVEFDRKLTALKAALQTEHHKKHMDAGSSEQEADGKSKASSEKEMNDTLEGKKEAKPADKKEDSKDGAIEKSKVNLEKYNTSTSYNKVVDQHPDFNWEDHKKAADVFDKEQNKRWEDVKHTTSTQDKEVKWKAFSDAFKSKDYHEKMAKQKYKKEHPEYHIAKFDKEHLGYSMTSKSDAR